MSAEATQATGEMGGDNSGVSVHEARQLLQQDYSELSTSEKIAYDEFLSIRQNVRRVYQWDGIEAARQQLDHERECRDGRIDLTSDAVLAALLADAGIYRDLAEAWDGGDYALVSHDGSWRLARADCVRPADESVRFEWVTDSGGAKWFDNPRRVAHRLGRGSNGVYTDGVTVSREQEAKTSIRDQAVEVVVPIARR